MLEELLALVEWENISQREGVVVVVVVVVNVAVKIPKTLIKKYVAFPPRSNNLNYVS